MFILSTKLLEHAKRTENFFSRKINIEGCFGEKALDLACYYKLPMMFIMANQEEKAKNILNHIYHTYIQENGDFKSSPEMKSIKPEYCDYWAYMNGWIIRAAYKLKLENIYRPALEYLLKFSENNQFMTNEPEFKTGVSDVLTVAHLGLIHLEMNNVEKAKCAGDYLCNALEKQLEKEKQFYLRQNASGDLITNFDPSKSIFYIVRNHHSDELYFMLGYPCAYLGLLYIATQEEKYLLASKAYMDFLFNCKEYLVKSNTSHKVAWAASILYRITGENAYLDLTESIVSHFMSLQNAEGYWYTEGGINIAYDQSPEIAGWFLDIAKNLNLAQKNTLSSKEQVSISAMNDIGILSTKRSDAQTPDFSYTLK